MAEAGTIAERVRRIVGQTIPPHRAFGDASRLHHDLGLDDLDRLCIGLLIEDEFGHYPPDEALENCQTVADLIAMVEQQFPAWKEAA